MDGVETRGGRAYVATVLAEPIGTGGQPCLRRSNGR
jgi:hypothetical protein